MIKRLLLAVFALSLAACGSSSNGSSSGTTAGSGSSGGSGSSVAGCSVLGIFDSTFQTSRGPGSGTTELDADAGWHQVVILGASADGGMADGGITTWIDGSWSLSGDQITLMGLSGHASNGAQIDYCPNEPGIYTVGFSSDCNTMTFTKVSDSCQERVFEGNNTPLHRR